MDQTKKRPVYWARIMLVLIVTVLALSLSLSLIIWAANPEDFGHPTNMSNLAKKDLVAGAPAMAASGKNLATAWTGELGGTVFPVGAQGYLYLQTANQNDAYWRPRVTVHTGTTEALAADPALIFDRNTVTKTHLVWAEGWVEVTPTSNRYYYQKIKYTWCDVSGDINTCRPATVITSTTADLAFRAPTIAQDSQGNLHVVWTEERSKKLYYRRWDKTTGWGSSSVVSGVSNAQTPRLAFSNGRLHLVWDDRTANQIKYIYDNNTANNTLDAGGSGQDFAPSSNFSSGNPGNPAILADGNNVFLAFDIDGGNDTFALAYAQSDNNGASWSNPLRDIPDQSSGNFHPYPSNTEDVTGGLKPSLALTATQGITYLHIVWHDAHEVGVAARVYQVYHAYRPVSGSFDTSWLPTQPLTVTNPPGASTSDEVLPGDFRVQGGDQNDSVMPALAITDPAAAGKLNLAYLERTSGQWDVYYRGFIAGTIDPLYIQDPDTFDLEKTVNPTSLFTSTNPVPAQTLSYFITITNKGTLDARKVGITDTFISGLAQIENINSLAATVVSIDDAGNPVGTPVALTPPLSVLPGGKSFTWYGTIPAKRMINISFKVLTKQLTPPVSIQNQVQIWNAGSQNQPIVRTLPSFNNTATTYIGQYRILLPLISKK